MSAKQTRLDKRILRMTDEKGYAFYCSCSRLVDLRKNSSTFCIGCGLFYHRWHDKSETIRNYVPPPSRET